MKVLRGPFWPKRPQGGPELLFGVAWVTGAALLALALRFYALGAAGADGGAVAAMAGVGLAAVLCLTVDGWRGWGGLAALAAFAVMVAVTLRLPDAVGPVVAVAGFGAAAAALRSGWSRATVAAVAGSAVLLAAVQLATTIKRGYATPLSHELALMGAQHRDTMFHSAIAGFLQTDGVVSIGLDGLVPLEYHAFSHLVIGSFGSLIDRPMLQTYGLFLGIVGGAALLVAFVMALRRVAGAVMTAPRLVLAVAAFALTDRFMGSFWVSESYLVSLVLMFVAIGFVAERLRHEARIDIHTLVALAVLVALVSFSKISTGAVMVCGLGVILLLAGRLRLQAWIGAALFIGLPFVLVYAFTFADSAAGGAGMFAPFRFLAERGEKLLVVVLALAVASTVLALRRRPHDPVLAGLAAMAWAGLVAGLLLDLPAGSTGYFVGPGLFAGLLAVLACVPDTTFATRRWIARLAFVLVAVHAVSSVRGAVVSDPATRVALLRETALSGALSTGLYARIVAAVTLRPAIAAVHVDPDAKAFWTGDRLVCWTPSLAVQALTARPVLGAILPQSYGCTSPAPNYGWSDYEAAQSTAKRLGPDEICAVAAAWHLPEVLEVGPDEALSSVLCADGKATGIVPLVQE